MSQSSDTTEMECSSLVDSCCSIHCTTEIITANLNTLTEVKFNTLKERISNLLKNLLTLPEEVSSVAQANKHLVDLPTSYVHDNCIYYHLSCFKKITHTRYQYPAVPSTSTSTPTKRSAAQSVASLHTETVEVSFTLFSTICMNEYSAINGMVAL